MTDLAVRSTSMPPAPPSAPRLSPWLLRTIDSVLDPHPDVGIPDIPLPVRQEAAIVLRQLDQHHRPASLAEWRRFLRPLVASVRNPPHRDDFDNRLDSVILGLPQLPAALLTVEAQRRAVLKFTFWPSVAEIAGLFATEIQAAALRRKALERIANANDKLEQRATEEDRQANAAKARALVQELRSRAADMRPRAARALTLTTTQQIATLEQRERSGTISPGEKFRLDHLRRSGL